MQLSFSGFLTSLWQHEPSIIILFGGGLIAFVLLTIDTIRHRQKRLARRRTSRRSSLHEFQTQLLGRMHGLMGPMGIHAGERDRRSQRDRVLQDVAAQPAIAP